MEHDPFRLGEPNIMCRSMPLGRTRPIELIVHTLLYTPNVSFELILELTVVGATDTEENTLSYAKKYGVLSRPGYLNRCMQCMHSNDMCSPNFEFLSAEKNQKRFVIEDK